MFRFIRKLQGRSARKKEQQRLAASSPPVRSMDDTYLVSYPKSGVTWLSFLIANTNLLLNGRPMRATWWNIHNYVTDISICRHVPPGLPIPGGRFIKSHATYHRYYHKVIYLVRDPREVMVSCYDMTTKYGWFHGSMDEFLLSPDWGMESWNRHVSGWLNRHEAVHIQFMHYRDLKRDASGTIKNLYSLFGITLDDALLAKAVELSSFENMRREEELYKKSSFEKNHDFKFVRQGVASGRKSDLTPEQIALIETCCGPMMKQFGYEIGTHSNP